MPVEGVELMDQPTFSDLEYQGKKRKTRRELFLERMDGLIPWRSLEARIGPFYPKAGRGRQPYPLAVMLRIPLCAALLQSQRPRAWRTCSTRPNRSGGSWA